MSVKQDEHHTFELGEISPDHVFRTENRDKSLKQGLNLRLLVSGAAESRPGTTRIAAALGDGWLVAMTIEASVFYLEVTATSLRVFDRDTRTLVQTLAGQAWTSGMLDTLVVFAYGSKAWVCHVDLPTQVITRADDGTWSVAAQTYGAGPANSTNQPYKRFAAPGVTLTPSALTGAGVTLTASAAYFSAAHVGLKLRLQGREVLITGYTSPTVVTATITQTLYPTVTLNVVSSTGFDVGDLVTGKDSGAAGEVVAVPDATHITVLQTKFTTFIYTAGPPATEQIIGPNTATTMAAVPAGAAISSVLDWDEQAISALRGYPATGTVHRNRLYFARLKSVPFGLAGSAIGAFTDFGVGTNDDDAFFVEIGDAEGGIIEHVQAAEQLLILTTRGVYYVPESELNPIRPTSIAFNSVGPDGASQCRPAVISEGIVYVEKGGGAVLGVFPTGDVRRSWKTADISTLAAHLIINPRSMAYIAGNIPPTPAAAKRPRYIYCVCDDGTMSVVYYSDSADVTGWVPWSTVGAWRAVAAADGECWTISKRVINGVDTYEIEVFDEDRILDCSTDVTTLIGAATGETILTPSGPQAADLIYQCPQLAGATCGLVIGGAYIGEVAVDTAGNFGAPDIAGAIELGFSYESLCVPWHYVAAEDQRARRRKQRILRAHVRWKGRGMAVNGKLQPMYRAGEDMNTASPERDEMLPVIVNGAWAYEPTCALGKPYPAVWQVDGVVYEVAL